MSDPLLTIKKSDGSYKKMPLNDFKMPDKKIPLQEKPMPVRPISVHNRAPVHVSSSSSTSAQNLSSPASISSPAEDIMASLSFKPNPVFEHRLRSAIQLRLKEIRGEEETKNTLMRDINQGGLGFSTDQSNEVLKKCQEHLLPQVYKKNLPMNSVVPQSAAPPTPKLHIAQQKPFVPLPKPVATKPLPTSHHEEEVFKITSKSPVKPVVTDIISKPLELGPVDEIAYMTLIDLRRLAPNPAEGAARFGQKFTNLKAESIMLYLDSVEAWKKSPLYADYTTTILKALAQKKKVPDVMGDKKNIQLPEIMAIVGMEKEVMTL